MLEKDVLASQRAALINALKRVAGGGTILDAGAFEPVINYARLNQCLPGGHPTANDDLAVFARMIPARIASS